MRQNHLHYPKIVERTNTTQKETDREEKKNRESEPTVCFIFHSNIISTTKNDSVNDQTTVC